MIPLVLEIAKIFFLCIYDTNTDLFIQHFSSSVWDNYLIIVSSLLFILNFNLVSTVNAHEVLYLYFHVLL